MTYPVLSSQDPVALPDRHDTTATVALFLSGVSLAIPALLWWRAMSPMASGEVRVFVLATMLGGAVAVASMGIGAWAMGTVRPRSRQAVLALVLGGLGLVASAFILAVTFLAMAFSAMGAGL